jgi:sigma-E factor negative regulatory protein RseB
MEASAEIMSDWYNFSYVGTTRIAGREGKEIALHPVDPYRLGYNFVVDQQTGLMLKSVATLPDRRALERMQFIDVSIDENSANALNDDIKQNQACPDQTIETLWRLEWVPEGFQQINLSVDGQLTSFLFGDGLSTFSLFIQPVDNLSLPVGKTQQGATTLLINYFSMDSLTFMVTFVGEIPIEAAERILTNIETT